MSADSPTGQPLRWKNAPEQFLAHLVVMPRWHKMVILIAGAMAVLGTAGQLVARFRQPAPQAPAPAVVQPQSSGGHSSFVDDSARPADQTAPQQPAATPADDTILGRLSPHATKIGLSVVLGFIVGWLCRAFLKTMALLTMVVIGGLWLLSHFGILHFAQGDVDRLREKSAEAASWLEQHARQLKDMAIAHLPSTSGGTFGALLGFRRRR
jgi:uncharacterized membrane protein (Fun14 family)